MNAFTTLMWLEFRKYNGWLLGLVAILAGCAWLFSQILRNLPTNQFEGTGAVLGIGLTTLIGLINAFAFFYGAEAGRDYRNGRWTLLLGSPLPGWLQVSVRVLFAFLVVTGLTIGMITLIYQMAIKPAGVVVPLGFFLSLWTYVLGGLPIIAFSLFLSMFTTAYLPRKTQVIAGFVGVLGSTYLVGLLVRLLEPIGYRLPAWQVPLPNFSMLPADTRNELTINNQGLPTEVFIALLVVSALLFYLTSRMWHEVEA